MINMMQLFKRKLSVANDENDRRLIMEQAKINKTRTAIFLTAIIGNLISNTIVYSNEDLPRLFLFIEGDEVRLYKKIIQNPCVSCVQGIMRTVIIRN